jgi:hypothetical protein
MIRYLLVILVLGSSSAWAQYALVPVAASGGGAVAVPSGVAIASKAAPFRLLVDAPNVAKFILGVDVSGDVIATAGGTISLKDGLKPVTVVGNMPKASVAAALGRFSARALPFVSTAAAIAGLASELNVILREKPGGGTIMEEPSQQIMFSRLSNWIGCTTGSTVPAASGTDIAALAGPIVSAASAGGCFAQGVANQYAYGGAVQSPQNPSIWVVTFVCTNRANSNFTLNFTSETVGGGPNREINSQEFADKIANKSGWPSTSNLAKATAAAIAAGEVVDVVPRSITGPADSPQTTDSTSTTGDITTTVKSKDSYTYKPSGVPYSPTTGTPSVDPGPAYRPTSWSDPGPSVTTAAPPSVVTTTTVTTSVTNTTTNITDTTIKVNTPPTLLPSSTPPIETVDPCIANPERLGCMVAGDVPPPDSLKQPDVPVVVTPVPFASSASCPAALSFTVFGATHEISYQPMCDQMSILRALMLCLAGVLAAYILADSFRIS